MGRLAKILILGLLTIIFMHVMFTWHALAQTTDGADCAELVRDVTIPRGSIVYPGEKFEKVWIIRNCGESEWITHRVVRVAGEIGQNSFSILPTAPKSEVEISIEIQAPMQPGNYIVIYEIARPFNDMRRMVRVGNPLVVEFRVARVIEVYLGDETEVEIKIEVEE